MPTRKPRSTAARRMELACECSSAWRWPPRWRRCFSAARPAWPRPRRPSARPQCPVPAVHLTGGQTSVTTAPGIAAALLGHGIVPLATLPGTEGASIGKSGVAVTFVVPGDRRQREPHAADRHDRPQRRHRLHRPGDRQADRRAPTSSSTSSRSVLTAIVNGNPQERVPLLSLSLAGAKVVASRHAVPGLRDRGPADQDRRQRARRHVRHQPVHPGPGARHGQHAGALLAQASKRPGQLCNAVLHNCPGRRTFARAGSCTGRTRG